MGNFSLNLKPLLLQPPVKGAVTMGLDPGYRNGCKVAVVDPTGRVLDTAVVYPTLSQRKKEEAQERLLTLIRTHHVRHIAIGNGTASRETEEMTAAMLRQAPEVSYMIVNEAGASVYSRLPPGGRGISGIRCESPLGHLHRPAASGSSGGAGEN